ncbi:MAG: patatin-like phospholipase family protein [Deltaproteobacteria bacterium]
MTSSILIALLLTAEPIGARAIPASLTVSGGVSLGAYEAGYLYYSLAAQRVNPGLSRLILGTGASAGSVNALLSLQASCAAPELEPRRSLFHRVWVPMGLSQLFRPDSASPVAAFSQKNFQDVGGMVEQELAKGLPKDCDVVLGVVASRLSPRLLEAAGGRLKVPVTEEKFVVRIRGRGSDRMPLITNYVDPDLAEEQVLLPEAADGSVPFAALLDAVIASTSFPVAFPPRPVAHCVVRTRGRTAPFCPEASATTTLFVDGGVFDNSPLRLAATYAAGGLSRVRGQELTWSPGPRLSVSHGPPSDVAFAFLSADAAAFPDQSESDSGGDKSLLPLLLREMGGFVNSARSRELYLLVEDYPETADNLIFPRRHFPAASSPMYAFYGFFDRGFRAFDFELGMYEARRQLTGFTLPRLPAETRARFVFPEDQPGARAASASWAPLACLRALFDHSPGAEELCAGDDLRGLRILAQVSFDRLWDRCAPGARWDPPAAGFTACIPAQRGEPPPRVPGVTGTPDWRRAPNESESTQTTRLLATYGYEWSDLPVPRGASEEQVLAALRNRLAAVTAHLAQAQPSFGEKVAVGAVGRMGVDLFFYVPPRASIWVTMGRALELGGDWAVEELSWLRLTGALEVPNLVTVFGSNPPPVAFIPTIGLGALPRQIGSPMFQPSFLVRGGYVLSPNDSFGGSSCEGQDRVTIAACTRPVVEAGAAAAIAGFLRIQLMGAWYPPAFGSPGLWALLPSLGFQLGL